MREHIDNFKSFILKENLNQYIINCYNQYGKVAQMFD